MAAQTFNNIFEGKTEPGMHELEGVFKLPGAADHPDLAGYEPSTPADLMHPITDPTKSPEEVAGIQHMMNEMIAENLREAAMATGQSFSGTGWTEETLSIPGSTFEDDAPDVEIVITTPPGEGTSRPLLLSAHGGALILGDAAMDSAMLFTLLENEQIGERPVMVQPNYRLAPNHQYPAAIEDLYATLAWCVDNAGRLGIDPGRIALLGSSSGATLGAALSFLARDRGFDVISAQMLLFPPLNDLNATKSSRIDLETWSGEQARKSWKAYLGDSYGRADLPPYAAPMRALDYRNLPPTVIHAAELDRDRDDAMQFAQRLLDSNVFTELHLWGGVFHSFPFLGGESEVGERFISDVRRSLKVVLSGKLPRREGQVYA